MTNKEIKKLAKQIASLEIKLQTDTLSSEERKAIERQIETLCMKVHSFQDMDLLDEEIQKNLKKL